MASVEPRAGRSRTTWLAVALLAALAYVPALASSPGKMPADTKLYLYLNPARLISDAPYTFDARQFAGWVPHQVIAYLWPQGPWFWLGDTVRLPDWVVHRLWIGTLMFLAGAGVLWLCRRRFGLGVLASLAAAIVYQLSPYLLPYVSRTSAMLLPWAGLGWLVGLTMGAALRTRWRDAALAALVVVSIGAVNATAIMMIIPGPLLWLIVAALERQVAWRRAVAAALRIGVLAVGVSLWWIAAVSIQGKLGADVLAYSESLKSVSFTSTSTEVWRQLGYWLTYIRDPYAATTTAGADYMTSSKVILAGFLLMILGVVGLVAVRWRQRRYAIALVVTGVVLGVGVHPIDDPSPLMRVLRGDGESGLALAMRSSTRAVPVLALGLGLGIAMAVQVLPAWRRSTAVADSRVAWAGRVPWRALATAGVLVLALVNLPVLTHHALVDPALERDEQPPAAWTDAAAALDAAPPGYRVMELPGAEFGAFRWGYTVDPPLPGLTNKPLVTRDLLPLGSAGAMDLLYALDDRFQAGVAETGAVAPVARLLGADTIWLPGDAAFDRFRTPRPEITHAQLAAAAAATEGLGMPVPYGAPAPNPPNVPMVDEQSLSDPRVGQPVPPVELVPVQDPEAVIRAKDRSVVIDGSGDGVVDSAAAGLLDGRELIRYAASLSGHDLATALQEADQVLITDSNRDRAHHWRGSQDVTGFTESGGPGSDVLDVDEGDQRLPVFTNDSARTQTIAVQEGPVTATASSYGEPFAYRPEDRPFMAVDGDPTTAWLVADRAPAEGQRIRFQVAEPIDHVTLHQPQGAGAIRHLGAVTIAVDGRAPEHVTLDERSLSAEGQRVDLDPTSGPSTVTITIDGVVVPDPTLGPASAAVGFSEVDFGLGPTVEVVRPPVLVTSAMTSSGTATPVTFVLTRLRTRPTDRWRSDPEAAMVREITVPAEQAFTPTVTVRLDQRATDAVLAGLLGITGAQANARLTGATSAAGWSATDGDPATAWITPFGQAVGSTLDAQAEVPLTELTVTQRLGDLSPVTGLRLTSGAATIDVTVPAPDASGVSHVTLPEPLPAGPVQVQITAIDPRTTIDRRYGEPVQLPAAIAELSLGPATAIPAQLDTGCRDDLVRIDGQPLPVRVQAAVPALLAGDAVTATPCAATAITLGAGPHRITTAPGAESGLQVDRVVLTGPSSAATAPAAGAATGPTATVTSSSRLSRKVTVDHCPLGCWLVLGEGFHDSWSATTAAGSLGPPQLVDGGFNGWRIPPSEGPTEVTLHWTSQRPLTIALVLSGLAVLAAIALAIFDRRRQPLPAYALPRLAFPGAPAPRPALIAGAVVWVAAAGLLVGPAWMLPAAVGSAVVLGLLRRPRLAGLVTVGILAFSAVVVVYVVRTDQPFPNAGWPVRFDWLHGLGLFAAVSLLPAAAGWPRRRAVADGSGQPIAPPGGDSLTRTAEGAGGGGRVRPQRSWLVPIASVAIAAVPVVVATVRTLHRGWMAIGDNGLILLRAQDVGTANHPLLGTWTSASQAAGQTISNPGPLWFDVLAPFVRVAGPNVGLAVAVMTANILAIVGAAWAAHRAGGVRAMVLATALSAGLAWSMGSELLFDAWQPHALLLPFWCLLLMLWALAAGDLLMAPFVVGIASLLVQTHLSYVYVVSLIGAATVVMVAVGLRRTAKVGGADWDATRYTLGRAAVWSGIVAIVAWIQPVIDQLFGEHNLGHLLSSSNGDSSRVGLGLGARFVASVVALPPWWTRPGFSSIIKATGVVDDPRGRTLAEGHVAGSFASLLGLLVVAVVLVAVAVVGVRRHARPLVTLALLAGASVAAALVSMVLMPIGVIGISPHQMRWLWPVSALALLAPAVALAEWPPLRRVVVPLGLAATILLAALNLPTYAAPEGPTADRAATGTAMALVDQLSSYRPGEPVLFDISVLRFAEPYSGPVLAALARDGVDVVVTDDGMVRQMGERRRAKGDERLRIELLEGLAAEQPPAGARRVAFVKGLDDAEVAELDRLATEVVDLASRDGLRLSPAGQRAVRAGRIDEADVVLAPGADATALETSGQLADLVANGYVGLDPSTAATFRRYAALRERRDRETVGLFELPITAG